MEQPGWRKARLRSPWKASLLVLSTTALSILILLGIVNSFLTRQRDPVGCGMVWMRPIYAKYEGFDSEWTRFASKYGLYLYREGGINEDFQVSRGTLAIDFAEDITGQRDTCIIHYWKRWQLQAGKVNRSRSS